uniref:Cupin-like domain-containing protein n=1 Tax=viral metagenome TaxID=1070528 RepID=A0A6C0B7P1_9ZZZZ
MEILINIIVFILLLFLYLHVNNQLKRSEDLEISEMDYIDNENLQEICELKQPILFQYKQINEEFFREITLDNLFNHASQEIKVKDSAEYFDENENPDYLYLPYKSANSLFISDVKAKYFSEKNGDFVEECGLSNQFEENNIFLKPSFTVNSNYDFMVGSKNVILPLRYHTNARQFLCVNSGKIHVKMTPWKSRKYLNPLKDYEHYDFRSTLNPWTDNENMSRLRFLEFDVHAGYIIYIPPFWFYSIKFSDSTENLVCKFEYNNATSFITNIPNYSMYYLQQSNIVKVLKIPSSMVQKDESVPLS